MSAISTSMDSRDFGPVLGGIPQHARTAVLNLDSSEALVNERIGLTQCNESGGAQEFFRNSNVCSDHVTHAEFAAENIVGTTSVMSIVAVVKWSTQDAGNAALDYQ